MNRKLVIDLKGISELECVSEETVNEWPWEIISGFLYAPDNEFFCFETPKKNGKPGEKENQVFRCAKQVEAIKEAVNQSIKERVEMTSKEKATKPTQPTNSNQQQQSSLSFDDLHSTLSSTLSMYPTMSSSSSNNGIASPSAPQSNSKTTSPSGSFNHDLISFD